MASKRPGGSGGLSGSRRAGRTRHIMRLKEPVGAFDPARADHAARTQRCASPAPVHPSYECD